MPTYQEAYRRSIEEPEAFWAEQARRIHWQTPFDQVLDRSKPPFARWFVGGKTNLCHNAVDRHLASRAQQDALVYVSTETGIERRYTYAELHAEVNRMAAVMRSLHVAKGDRVLIYLPMIPEALFAMLACARIGAIHSVVFGGFAAPNLAARIDDAEPALIVTADAGARAGKVIDYTPLVDEALSRAEYKVPQVLLIDRQLAPERLQASYLVSYEPLREQFFDAHVPCEWLESTSLRTCFTRPARRAGRRACSAMSAVTRWRSPHRWSTFFRARRATRCSPHRMSAGSSGTATSSMRR